MLWSIWRQYWSPTGRCSGSFSICCVGWLLAEKGCKVVTHPPRSRRHQAKSLNDLDFADDIPLLESSISQAQAQLSKTAEAAADLSLVISAPKTEYVTVNCNPQPTLQVYGYPINHVSDFRYLGSMVASGSSDLKRRKSLAWCAFWKLEQLWKSPHIPIATKVMLFNTNCVTIYYSMGVNHGWSPRTWETKSTPLLPHATESCWI